MLGACFLHVGVYVTYVHTETHAQTCNSAGAQCEVGGKKRRFVARKPWFLITVLPGTPYGMWSKTTCQDSVSSTVRRNNPDGLQHVYLF